MSGSHDDLFAVIGLPHPDRAPLPPAAPAGPGVRVLRGVPYADVPGSRPLELDLWLPERGQGDPPSALMLAVHGGAWRFGRRGDMGYRMRDWQPGPFARFAAAGFVVAAVDYRLNGEATFPAPLDDLHAALRWLALRSGELGVDTGRTVVWGESAGAHLVSLLALGGDVPVAGAIAWYGPSDLTLAGDDPTTPEALLLGGAPTTRPDLARQASPLAQVRPGAPPFLLVHGEEDTVVDCEHSRRFAARLAEVGARVDLRTVPGAEHVWHGLSDGEVEEIFAGSLEWARDRARRGGE
ncbi:alpha/beta hydrolase [Streptomyces sp. NPDC006997]|uniref:alpha/beta hydrolase n=1 Tax=Streptomyces sp. NPDC006997 TaxID=3155356 RepID=UPI0033C10C7C